MTDSAREERLQERSRPSSIPAVSVVMPVHDEASYPSEALDSLFAQTYQDFEVICIDDGSTDGTASLLEAYQRRDSRLVSVISRAPASSTR
jgi:glycosyltransferase involved in cell wall biosynthesis